MRLTPTSRHGETFHFKARRALLGQTEGGRDFWKASIIQRNQLNMGFNEILSKLCYASTCHWASQKPLFICLFGASIRTTGFLEDSGNAGRNWGGSLKTVFASKARKEGRVRVEAGEVLMGRFCSLACCLLYHSKKVTTFPWERLCWANPCPKGREQ